MQADIIEKLLIFAVQINNRNVWLGTSCEKTPPDGALLISIYYNLLDVLFIKLTLTQMFV